MRIIISGRASVYASSVPSESGATPVIDPAVLRSLDGYDGEEDPLSDDPAPPLWEAGVRGGTLTFTYDALRNELRAASEYRCSRALTEEELHLLVRETQVAWSDGIGENGFEAEWEGGRGYIYPVPDGYPLRHTGWDLRAEQRPE